MVLANPAQVAPTRRTRKSYFPFPGLMRSVEFEGLGAQLAENVVLDDGHLQKMKGPSIQFTRSNKDAIYRQFGFKNSSDQYLDIYLIDASISDKYILEAYNLSSGATTYPILAEANEVALTGTLTFTEGSTAVSASGGAFTTEVAVGDYIYLDGEYSDGVRVASITDDDNLVLESNYGGTGGSGNGKSATRHFTTTDVFFRQLGDEAYLACNESSNSGYSFDGTTLTNISNFPVNCRYLLLDGNRLVVNEEFSSEISSTMTDWDAGTGVQTEGRYATGLEANGGIETSAGIILFDDTGAEIHKVIPNNASDDVSAETRMEGFNYKGPGVENTYQVCAGPNFVYIIVSKGIFEINPFTGESRILTDKGNIGKRWPDYTITYSTITYDPKNDYVVAMVTDIGQLDTVVVIDLGEDHAISVQPNSYIRSLVNINNQLYGGSSIDGKVLKMFDTFSTRDDTAMKFRWVLEWDSLDGVTLENILKRIRIHARLNSSSSMTISLYKNGSQEPVYTETFSGSSSRETQTRSVIGTSGFYTSGLGGSTGTTGAEEADVIKKIHNNENVSTYALEIEEESVYDFAVYNLLSEYKTRKRFTREYTMPTSLFS